MVEVFDPIANHWEKCQPMTTARSRVGVAVLNGLLYAIGGYDGQLRLSTVEVYNPEADSWSKVGSMNSKRRCVCEDRVFTCAVWQGGEHCVCVCSVRSRAAVIQQIGLIWVAKAGGESHTALSFCSHLHSRTKMQVGGGQYCPPPYLWGSDVLAVDQHLNGYSGSEMRLHRVL